MGHSEDLTYAYDSFWDELLSALEAAAIERVDAQSISDHCETSGWLIVEGTRLRTSPLHYFKFKIAPQVKKWVKLQI
ncbi:hypothetical protein CY34DRAFT_805727 [Suillus luteus UH-Slu-Lm8-n1]|uniref:Uncharacterized protein n=1 Tax=Suillus luteus UH-Slu-Lm8-n1 TaxID=930992 RepID=A0A0C9ZV21_9AGAM|nr:hypothetical protein CY34DRAFT_805727 [Suillus luteus UH-Slu-Lm8-n1]